MFFINDGIELIDFFNQEGGIAVMEEWNMIPDPTRGMKGGVLILRGIPDGEIGKGMEGGVVIIENEQLMGDDQPEEQLAELRSKISDEIIGGLVFARVKEIKPPLKTGLVALNF